VVDLLLETLRSLRAHAVRFVLTSLGVAWGALLLTFLSAQMGGMRSHFMSELEEVGPKLVFMGAGVVLDERTGAREARKVELEPKDVTRLADLASIDGASPEVFLRNEPVRSGRRSKLLNVVGYDADAGPMRKLVAAEGRFITPLDVERGARVAFIGPEAKRRLFGSRPAIGERIAIESQPFTVIGIGVSKGEQLTNVGSPDDQMIVIPYTTAMRWLQRSDAVSEFMISPRIRERGAESIRGVRELTGLHRRFDPDQDTALWAADMWDVIKLIWGMFVALQGFFIVAGTITLLVGAVGVMNIMLVVVGERTAEIGLRKALGARGRDIFCQFLLEALAVALIASALGIGGGLLAVRAIAPAFERGGIHLPTSPDPLTLAAIAAALVAVALVAGVAPAVRAARIPPAEALRSY
jgi:putative ABC transport system permease protein